MAKREISDREKQIIALAQDRYQAAEGCVRGISDGDIDIDDDALVSEGDENGCFVAAWVWVRFDGTPLDKKASPKLDTTPETEPDPEEANDWKREKLEEMGYFCGPRDARLNTDFPGAFMVTEDDFEEGHYKLPTRDASNGPWCIVGDDLAELIDEAWEEHREGTDDPDTTPETATD
jgi:hypothetical protein